MISLIFSRLKLTKSLNRDNQEMRNFLLSQQAAENGHADFFNYARANGTKSTGASVSTGCHRSRSTLHTKFTRSSWLAFRPRGRFLARLLSRLRTGTHDHVTREFQRAHLSGQRVEGRRRARGAHGEKLNRARRGPPGKRRFVPRSNIETKLFVLDVP